MTATRGPSSSARPGCGLLFLLLVCGCLKPMPPEGQVLDRVQLRGAKSLGEEQLLNGLATRPSDHLLFWSGVVGEYRVLDEALLARDLQRIVRQYQSQGFYDARITGAYVTQLDGRQVAVTVVVQEGPRVMIGSRGAPFAVQLHGLESLDDPALVAEVIAASPEPGTPFNERRYEASKRAMREALQDAGYAFAKVNGKVEVDLVTHRAQIQINVESGPKARFGAIQIQGLERLPALEVQDQLSLREGEPYSAAAITDARRALLNLGVFASVVAEADLSRRDVRSVPVTFRVREAAPRTVRLGGGLKLDALELSSDLLASWEHKNFFGGLRHLSLEARPGAVFLPTRIPTLDSPQSVLLKSAVHAKLRQPALLGGRTAGFLDTGVNVRPLLYTDTTPTDPLTGFVEVRAVMGLERALWGHRLQLTPSLNFRAEVPVDYRALTLGLQSREPAASLQTLRIVYPELAAALDLRDDPVDTRSGLWASSSLQWATPLLGSTVSDVRIHPELRLYTTKERLTLALRGAVGVLLPANYGASLGQADTLSGGDQQRLFFRGFFSGGALSNRGYTYQGVGNHDLFSADIGRCANLERECERPTGGLSLWETSLELRFRPQALEPLAVTMFVDASDVRVSRLDYGWSSPHLSPGVGLRYLTPVGPLRVDLGYRLLEALGQETAQGQPPRLFGQPLALHLALGEAF